MPHPFTLAADPVFALAWSDEWPGMVCGARNVEALHEAMPRTITEFASWLEAHGVEGPAGTEWEIAQLIDPSKAGSDPCHASDLHPLAEADSERFMRYAAFAQEDLRLAAAVPDLLLDWKPDGLVVEDADPWAPDPRSMRGILTHALQLEVFYREGLKDGPAAGIFERVVAPAEEQFRTRAVLRSVAEAGDLDRVFHPIRPHRLQPDPPSPGDWTLRKVFRRLISHDRAHAAEIIQRRTWALLGVPRDANSAF